MIDILAPIQDWLPTVIYPGHRTGLPDVVMGRWPDVFGRSGPRRWKTWICESTGELREVRRRLAKPCPLRDGALDFKTGPDGALTGIGAGMMPRDSIVVALYQPPAEGWPWLILQSVPVCDPTLERGKYSWEALDSEDAALAQLERLAQIAQQSGTEASDIHIMLPETRQ